MNLPRFRVLILALVVVVPLSVGSAQATGGAAQSVGALLDINTASLEQLMGLPGMGEAYAQRVVRGRPYTAKNQLVTRGILPQPTYDKVQAKIIAKRPSK